MQMMEINVNDIWDTNSCVYHVCYVYRQTITFMENYGNIDRKLRELKDKQLFIVNL